VGHTSTVWDVAFSPSGDYLASCSDDTTLKIYKCSREYGEMKCSVAATCSGYHNRTIFSIDWAPLPPSNSDSNICGYIASASADNRICIFAVKQAVIENGGDAGNSGASSVSCQLECRKEQAHPCDVNCVRWHPKDGSLLASAGDDGCIKIWKFEAAAENL
jgi:cytosolic iron-sulfur protein assembly protein CIAO1